MFNMSKIFKRHDEEAKPEGSRPQEGAVERSEDDAFQKTSERKPEVKLSGALNKELDKAEGKDAVKLYDEVLEKAKKIYASDLTEKHHFAHEVNPVIEKVVDYPVAGSEDLVLAALKDYPDKESAFCHHITNVTIISLRIGAALEYDRARLLELGLAAFVHDIGAKNIAAIEKAELFTEKDYDRIREHPAESAKILEKMDAELNGRVIEAVRQEHERVDGSGYPKGLIEDEISEYAKVIGLADVYEALVHDRPYREKYTSLDAMRMILNNKKTFSPKVIKGLILGVGVFPVGTLVSLNTKEVGVVVKRDPDHISRPIINIIIDSSGKELKGPKRINLADSPVVYIDTCVKRKTEEAVAA